jgi:hypothetical protein
LPLIVFSDVHLYFGPARKTLEVIGQQLVIRSVGCCQIWTHSRSSRRPPSPDSSSRMRTGANGQGSGTGLTVVGQLIGTGDAAQPTVMPLTRSVVSSKPPTLEHARPTTVAAVAK